MTNEEYRELSQRLEKYNKLQTKLEEISWFSERVKAASLDGNTGDFYRFLIETSDKKLEFEVANHEGLMWAILNTIAEYIDVTEAEINKEMGKL